MSDGFRFTATTKQKTSQKTFEKVLANTVKKTSEELLKYIQEEGVGVSKGQTPSGGAPVWQGDPKLDHNYPGFLRDTHYIEQRSWNYSEIKTYADYVNYVINGHIIGWSDGMVNIPPNPYHKRAFDKLSNGKKLDKFLEDSLRDEGLI